jgi:hypothetical protein
MTIKKNERNDTEHQSLSNQSKYFLVWQEMKTLTRSSLLQIVPFF